MEAKIDALLKLVDAQGEKAIRELDLQYDGRYTDEPHAHRK
jgi:hypothetical protein